MQLQLSAIFYGLAVLQGAIASPVAEPAVEVEERDIEPRAPSMGDIPWPRLPALRRKFTEILYSDKPNLIGMKELRRAVTRTVLLLLTTRAMLVLLELSTAAPLPLTGVSLFLFFLRLCE